jgi:hypothetical protein
MPNRDDRHTATWLLQQMLQKYSADFSGRIGMANHLAVTGTNQRFTADIAAVRTVPGHHTVRPGLRVPATTDCNDIVVTDVIGDRSFADKLQQWRSTGK